MSTRETFLGIIARFRSRNYREKTVDSIFRIPIERRENSNGDRKMVVSNTVGKKMGGTGVFNYKNIVPGGLLFVQL